MSANIPKPIKLFSFCAQKKDGKNEYDFDEKMFPVFHTRPVIFENPLNLVSGINKSHQEYNSLYKLNHWDILTHINNSVGLSLGHITDHSNVVCHREFLKDLILRSFGIEIEYTSVAFLYNDIVFIEKVDKSTKSTIKEDLITRYMNKKFNCFFTSLTDNDIYKANLTFDFYRDFYVTQTREFKASDSTIKVMYTGEVDAINSLTKSKHNNFLRMKLSPDNLMSIMNGSALYKTWAEAFIAGNDLVFAGVVKNNKLVGSKFIEVSKLEPHLPLPAPKIMEFVGKSLKTIINACKKLPGKCIIIPEGSSTIKVGDKETVKSMEFPRPTTRFFQAFPA
uniref:Decapping nuclease n=1 Tax=Strongyloides papillosus TaxID=174720 RepID=A0A0N5CGP1_STREA